MDLGAGAEAFRSDRDGFIAQGLMIHGGNFEVLQ